MKDQVRRMAENDEPKCKNCSWWQRIADDKTIGCCMLNQGFTQVLVPDKPQWGWPETTDLSLCSAWEPKE